MNRYIIVVVVVAGVILALACQPTGTVNSTQLMRTQEKVVLPQVPTEMECAGHDGKSAVVVPLTSDENNIFNIDLRINDTWVRAAVDTGSEALVISGDDCERCRLNDEQGTVPMSIQPTHLSTMTYGSQSDSVEWDKRPVFLKGWKVTCASADDDGALTTEDDPSHLPVCVVGSVEMAIVKKRTGTSNYNVLGLGARTKYGPPAFLSSMFPEPPRAFAIYIKDKKHARLVLHRPTPSCNPPKHLFPIDRGDLSSHQYLLRISTVEANDEPLEFRPDAYRLMLDTGANAISLPRALYSLLKRDYPSGSLSFHLDDNMGKPVKLSFPYDMADRFNAQILDAGPVTKKIIVGCTFMFGMGIGIYETPNERYVSVDW